MIEPGQLVRYKGHHVNLRGKPWVYLGDTRSAGQRMAWLIAPEHAPNPLPTGEEMAELQRGAIKFYGEGGDRGHGRAHPARLASKDWWFDVRSVYAEDISACGSIDVAGGP